MKIQIKAGTGEGKSAVAWAIKKALSDAHIECQISGCEDEEEGVMEATWQDRLKSLKGKAIEIETIQIASRTQ
jgi:hypothetical protein